MTLGPSRHALKEYVSSRPAIQWVICGLKLAAARRSLQRGDLYGFAGPILFCRKHFSCSDSFPGFRRAYDRLREEIRAAARRPVAENPFLEGFLQSGNFSRLRQRLESEGRENIVRLRLGRGDDVRERQGDLMILKAARPGEEKGGLCIKYNMGIASLPAFFDLASLARDYSLLLEPSTWGYQDPIFLLYLGCDLEVLIQSQSPVDYDFIEGLATNLKPIRIGAGDWIDPRAFSGKPRGARKYDLVMVAGWDRLKRHREFFTCVRSYREKFKKPLRMAMVGYPMSATMVDIKRDAAEADVLDQCEFHEQIPYAEVADIIGDSRVGVIWSKREGASKALYEYIWSDTPVIVYGEHRGINLGHVTPRTGILSGDDRLHDDIEHVLTHGEDFEPRAWAEENTGWQNSTRLVNSILRTNANERGDPWTGDLAAKTNGPNLDYVSREEAVRFFEDYRKLEAHLR